MLDNLKLVAAEMADYINNGIDENVVEMIKQGKNTCYKNGDYIGYLKNMGDLMRMERISSICRNQMPDEKAYF